LRIADEDINVETLTVADLKHRRSAAAKLQLSRTVNFELAWLIIFWA